MHLAMIGLGKMGGNMVRRLRQHGIDVTGYDHAPEAVNQLAKEAGMKAAKSVADAIAKLPTPRIIWLMLPAGSPTESQILALAPMLDKGDIIIDGGNSNYKESQRRGAWLAEQGIGFMDAGTSGGVWGLENGYCLMVGATPKVAKTVQPILEALSPQGVPGWAHVGPVGAGHFTKMIHNGIEYGMMQAFAEGLDLMRGKEEFNLDLAQITELWRHSSVVRSWLLDLTADALKSDQKLDHIKPYVPDSGEGRWTVVESIEQGVAAPVLTLALQMRFSSQDELGYSYRLLSLMRNAFGGHAVALEPAKKAGKTSKSKATTGKVDQKVSAGKPKPPNAPAVPHEDIKTPDAPRSGKTSKPTKAAPKPIETQVQARKGKK